MLTHENPRLRAAGRQRLLRALSGRLLAVCFGAGVDSTAMLIALRLADLRPDVITFADVAAEKPETMVHLDRIGAILAEWGWPPIIVCRKVPLASTGYDDLYGNCIVNETLPSLAFGMKSCSLGLAFSNVSFGRDRIRANRRANQKAGGGWPGFYRKTSKLKDVVVGSCSQIYAAGAPIASISFGSHNDGGILGSPGRWR